tara:strand:+ start:52 stop:696 length:645 start_codon:yes stop_codon:yes gene_type:complete
MAFILDGTTGIATIDGSVSAPSQRGQDSNSGISYAADTIKFSTGGVERMAITNSGISNVGKILNVVAANKTDAFSATASDGTYHDITGLSVSITITGTNDVLIFFQSSFSTGSDFGQRGSFRLVRGSTAINIGDAAGSRTRGIFPSMEVRQTQMSTPVAGCFLDENPSAGTYTYKLQVSAEAGAGTVVVNSTSGGDSATHYRGASNLIVMEVAS